MIVTYSNGKQISNKNSGIYLSKKATASAPNIDFGDLLEKDKYYTLIVHDPYAVNDNHNVNHWIITNIQLTKVQGTTLLDYKGPHPPSGSGIHKYFFTLYLQPTVFKLTKGEAESDLREAQLLYLLVKLGLKDAEIIDQVFFTSSFAKAGTVLRKGGRKTRRKRRTKRKSLRS